MRVAIVHDWLNQMGGAELVLEAFHELFPEAPIFTSIYAPELMPPGYREWDIRTSFMQRLPLVTRHHQPFLPLYPLVFERLDLAAFDVVISNSSGFCHIVRPGPKAVHVNYCLTPPRFLWAAEGYLERERFGGPARWLLWPLIRILREADLRATQQVHRFAGISKAVVERIRRVYGRDADLIYPPVDISRYALSAERGDFFLVVSRLVPYKRVDVAVRAFNELGLPLYIVGDGRDRPALEALARPNIRFFGRLPQHEVAQLFASCRAFIFPGEEDFGIAPLEANASGRPVIAYRGGGALDTISDGTTGLLFSPQTPEALAAAVAAFVDDQFDPPALRRHAESFAKPVFKERILGLLSQLVPGFAIGAPESRTP